MLMYQYFELGILIVMFSHLIYVLKNIIEYWGILFSILPFFCTDPYVYIPPDYWHFQIHELMCCSRGRWGKALGIIDPGQDLDPFAW